MRQYFLLFSLLAANVASANVVINSTRVIYPEKNNEVIVQLLNNGDRPSLVQSWIDDGDINSTPETARVPFLLSPPVVKVSAQNGQQLRIKKLPAALPTDRESVFYLNVLDIPPVPENMQNVNTVQLAIKSRIKLFYRPAGLKGTPASAINNVSLSAAAEGFNINNNSPFNITIANVEINDKKILTNAVMVSPYSHTIAPSSIRVEKGRQYSVVYVDDFGAYQQRKFTAQ